MVQRGVAAAAYELGARYRVPTEIARAGPAGSRQGRSARAAARAPRPEEGPRSACAQPRHDAPRRLSALGSRLSVLSALATARRGPLQPLMCRRHAPRGTTPSHSRWRHPRLRRGHRPSTARRGIGPSPPGGRAVSRPTRPWCAVTASSIAYPAGKSHWLKLRPRPPSRSSVLWGVIIQINSRKVCN